MVRYLRNALMAKLGGEQTELLQISGDERARAMRTALLFSEEELTRNLQIVLRTFDDLNYRQEQRFHLELGLLKLVHAQRLLPLEELLSGVASGGGLRTTGPSPASRPSASPPRPSATPAATPAIPTYSPFGPGAGGWNSTPSLKQTSVSAPMAEMELPTPSPATEITSEFRTTTPFPVAPSQSARYPSPESLTEGALAKAPDPAPPASSTPTVEALRHAIGSALVTGGHESAAQLLGAGAWTLDGANLRIEVAGMGKKMLSLTVNAAAEKIIRQELQRLGASTRFLIVSGGHGAVAPAVMSAPLAGSVQEEALANPLVQRAKEIFKADVRSVVDLRKK
jgi:DNA polymerase-3 subunit gamma/tau